MPVATASREAYGRMRTVKPKEHPVYKFLKTFGTGTAGYSNRQIALIMKRPINTITPRIFELRQAGVVVLAGKRKDTYSGIEVSHWRIATEAEEAAYKGVPRTWDTLAEVPAGVTVSEDNYEGVLWRNTDGDFTMGNATTGGWSGGYPLSVVESTYGPVTEVL